MPMIYKTRVPVNKINHWANECYKENQFKLWTLGCTNKTQFLNVVRRRTPYNTERRQKLKNDIEEYIIIKNPYRAFHYARDVIGYRWPMGEAIIATSARFSVYYACDILHGKFPLGEPEILKHVGHIYDYFSYFYDPPWPKEAEKILSNNSYYAMKYAKCILKKRWKKAEQTILENPYWGVEYAYYVMKERWPELEVKLKTTVFLKEKYENLFSY